MPLVVGLFVGGIGSRFGGMAKGNLRLPSGVRLIERLMNVCQSALPDAPLVLVGRSESYSDLAIPSLADSPAGIGPLGGLRALLAFADHQGRDAALALACDMPSVTPELVGRLANESPEALALAARDEGRWQALAARYSISIRPVLDAALEAREHSLQRIFRRLGERAHALPIDDAELRALVDWDSPDDVTS